MRAIWMALVAAAVGCGGGSSVPTAGSGAGGGGADGGAPGGGADAGADAGLSQDGGTLSGDAGVVGQDGGLGTTDGGGIAPDGGSTQSGSTRWFSTDPTMVPYTGLAGNPSGEVIGVGSDGRMDARDGSGNVLWVRQTMVHNGIFTGVDVSPGSGDIAVRGYESAAEGSHFVARYAPDGTNPQVTYTPGIDEGDVADVALSVADDMFYATTNGMLSTLTYTTAAGSSWQVSYATNTDGGSIWLNSPLAVDPERDAVSSALTSGEVTLQGRTFGTAGTRTPTLLGFSANGALQWVQTLDGLSPSPQADIYNFGFNRVRTSNAGTVVTLCDFEGTTTWGGQQTSANGPILLTAEANGAQRWMKALPLPKAGEMALDPRGKVAVIGQTTASDGQTTCNAMVVIQYDLAGDYLWTRQFPSSGCSGSVQGNAAASVNGDIVIGGTFQGTVDFGTGPTSAQSGQPFILDLRP